MNRDTPSNKLRQMKDEILLLKEELVRARLESRSVSSVVTASSVGGANTGSEEGEERRCEEGEGRGREEGEGTRRHLEELEDRLNQSQVLLQSYLVCVKSVRGKLTGVLGGGGDMREGEREERGGKLAREEWRKVLEECVCLLTLCDGEGVLHLDLTSTASDETIALLRLELEQCRADLRTDESAFAEKAEEMADLQYTCEVLAREKGRIEGMWVAAQESEAELQAQVDQLSERLAALAPPVGGGAVGVAEREATAMGVVEGVAMEGVGVATSSEQGVAEVGGDSLSEGVASISAEIQRFEVTRSLIRGKVKTGCVEVSGWLALGRLIL